MTKLTRKSLCYQPLFRCFFSIQDQRVQGRCLYPLLTVLILTLCGLICGHNTWKGIVLFAHQRKRWLSQFVDLPHGIPSPQTIARIFSLIKPVEFENGLHNWIAEICPLLAYDIINLDGKT